MFSWYRSCHCLSDLPPPSTRERPPGCRTVFVGGLPENATEDIIREVFDQCGEITAIRKSKKNFCHIRFSEEFMVDKAIYLSGEHTVIFSPPVAPAVETSSSSLHQGTGCVSDPAPIRRTLGRSMWTSLRPETTCMSGSVNSAYWPERKDTAAPCMKSACGLHPLLPSCTTPSTRQGC